MKKNSTISTIDKVLFKGSDEDYVKPQRNYFVRCYHSFDVLKPMLADCKHYAYILHDKDNKEPHGHAILCFKDAKTPSAVCKLINRLDKTQGAFVDVLDGKYTAFDYMLHRDERSVKERKHRYDAGEIYSDDISYFDRVGDNESKGDKTAEFVADLLDNKPTYREMAMRYGRDYIKNADSYHRFEERVAYEEDILSKHERLMKCDTRRIANGITDKIMRYVMTCFDVTDIDMAVVNNLVQKGIDEARTIEETERNRKELDECLKCE